MSAAERSLSAKLDRVHVRQILLTHH
eukprot:COSAG01_NODE_61292_length_290_cov_0.816754_1_plen_25_part_10